MEMKGGSRQVNASGMSVPTFERTVRAKNFAIELQTADPQRPVLSFPMSRRAAAQTLNRKFNTSPSLTTYSLPSARILPASLAPASPL